MPNWPNDIVAWFKIHQRSMPWRSDPQPYKVWVSEIMLQQTQVDTVIPYFNRFIKQFPTVNDLARAEQEKVLKAWEGLGYYSRARNLHKAAKLLVSDYSEILPETYEALQKLPGIGPYVAAAITSIAFGHQVPVVDGNVLRVFTRFWGIYDDISDTKTRKKIFEKLSPPIKTVNASDFNQGIMEIGALICKPKQPKCHNCPIAHSCYAYKNNKTTQLPVKAPKAKVPHYDIAVGIIWKDDKILIGKRKEEQMLGGLWEFPGGKQKENETLEQTVIREVKEECDIVVNPTQKLASIKHAYTHFKITLHAYHCQWLSGSEKALSATTLKWISLDEIEQHPFPTANKKILAQLQKTDLGPLFTP